MTATFTKTLRIKVKPNSWAWLDRAAVEVNQVWNWANETSAKAARPFAGSFRWLSRFELDRLSAGATKYVDHIGADTIQRVNAEYATRRKQFKRARNILTAGLRHGLRHAGTWQDARVGLEPAIAA